MPEFLAGFVLGNIVAAIIGVLWHRNIIQTKARELIKDAEDRVKGAL